jgi:hypothetical protein
VDVWLLTIHLAASTTFQCRSRSVQILQQGSVDIILSHNLEVYDYIIMFANLQ